MKVRDQKAWDKWVSSNSDGGYGEQCLDFAEAWADLMEQAIAEGAKLEDIAEPLSHVAAKPYGLSGFQYGAAVVMLCQCWEHGERLRIWHNLDTQIGDEGERANESGETLNPAVMILGEK